MCYMIMSSYISAVVNDDKFNRICFRFKDSRDAVEKYEIVTNGITIYTQNFGCEESFLSSCCANETTKIADIYFKARHKDIWDNNSESRTGFVVDWNDKLFEFKKIKVVYSLTKSS